MIKHKLQSKKIIYLAVSIVLTLLAASTILQKVFTGGFALWYDPSRDLLLGLDNLHKLTLIGPTSGIPGVFYGPYWIWMISFAQLISKDPRVVLFIILTLPYLIFFPFLLSRFSKIFGFPTILLLWLLFLLSEHQYLDGIWNPYPALILILLTIYLLFSKTYDFSLRNKIRYCLIGFTEGLVMNFHLSFGIGMLFGLIVYLFGELVFYLYKDKNKKRTLVHKIPEIGLFFVGLLIAFLPFIAFEVRHQFLQTKTLITALLLHGAVVSLKGLSHPQMITAFFGKISDLLQLPFLPALLLFFASLAVYLYQLRKRHDQEKKLEIKLLLILSTISFVIMALYLTTKNPIWSYHFIGFEVIFLLAFGVIINRLRVFQILLGLWIGYLLIISLFRFYHQLPVLQSTIAGTVPAKENAVKKIHEEGYGTNYVVYAYSPSIYYYEYSYLFRWLYNQNVPYRPELNPKNASIIFLIIPPQSNAAKIQDFIHYRAPAKVYSLQKEWTLADGTKVLKEVHNK